MPEQRLRTQLDALIAAGWTIEYSAAGAIAYLPCRWCPPRKPAKACAACHGTGARETRRV